MKFTATKREGAGTSASKKIRKEEQVPGIVYSRDIEPIKIQMPVADVELLERDYGLNSVLELDIEGDETRTVFLRDISRSALKPIIYNISFQAIKKGDKLDIDVPVQVVDDDQLADDDGVVSNSMWEVRLRIDPAKAPEAIEVSVKDLHIGDSITVADLAFDGIEDAEILDDPEETVLAISVPDEEPTEEEVEEDLEEDEPEVINEKGEDSEEE
ncbi:MAG: 50S ribosomal protein L25 [Aerococcus sp.]|nr:50S ribosomal protein L25 [Aerococcus sp.]